jgi:hypothetical protein
MDLSFEKTIGKLPEPKTFVFVVKIWMEDYNEETGEIVWRGYLKDLLQKENKKYFNSLKDLNHLVESKLDTLDVPGAE